MARRKMSAIRPIALLPALLPLTLAACVAAPAPPAAPAAEPLPLPLLPVEQVAELRRPGIVAPNVSSAPRDLGPPVTLAASNVSVRALLPALAEAAGISLVMGPAIEGTVSVNLQEVPALEALYAVLEEAGLGLVAGRAEALWGPVVFYPVPVNIERASPEVLRARFGVSREMADWIVENRRVR